MDLTEGNSDWLDSTVSEIYNATVTEDQTTHSGISGETTPTELISTTSVAVSSTTTDSDESGAAIGAIIGGVIGGLIVVAAFITVFIILIKKRKGLVCCHEKTETERPNIAPSLSTVNFNEVRRVENQISESSDTQVTTPGSQTYLIGCPGLSIFDLHDSPDSHQNPMSSNQDEYPSSSHAIFTIADEDDQSIKSVEVTKGNAPENAHDGLSQHKSRKVHGQKEDIVGGMSNSLCSTADEHVEKNITTVNDNIIRRSSTYVDMQFSTGEGVKEDTYDIATGIQEGNIGDGTHFPEDIYDISPFSTDGPVTKTPHSSSAESADRTMAQNVELQNEHTTPSDNLNVQGIAKVPTYVNLSKFYSPPNDKDTLTNEHKNIAQSEDVTENEDMGMCILQVGNRMS